MQCMHEYLKLYQLKTRAKVVGMTCILMFGSDLFNILVFTNLVSQILI